MAPSTALRFERLTSLLAEWYPIWAAEPFQYLEPPWAALWPKLARELRATSGHASADEGADPGPDPAELGRWLPTGPIEALVDLPRLPSFAAPPPDRWGLCVGGRKWRQIAAFAPRVSIAPGQSIVEWCAGKGHLARTLARSHQMPVTGLESDVRLCREGQALAEHQGVAVCLEEQDVLGADVSRWLDPATHVVALHACGDLHLRLLDLVAETGSAITLAPCCYHRTVHERHQPRSETGGEFARRHTLALTRRDLALAVQETVTAPRHARRQRRKAKAWRLAFDSLQRKLRGVDAYLPVPRLRHGDLPQHFEGFCRWAAAQKRLSLPAGIDWSSVERDGWRRLGEVEMLERVRHRFRRPLEVWLALDRAHQLLEAGFQVDLGTFCAAEVTPRNLLLRAARG